MTRQVRIQSLLAAIPDLSDYRLQLVDRIVSVFGRPRTFWRSNTSTLISKHVLEDFGDVLCLHHCFSREPFSKDKFEYALEGVLNANDIDSMLAPRGQRGYDIRIRHVKYSLKTEAAKGIDPQKIHISKFMELGGGTWGDDPSDLIGLRTQFLAALGKIERILILRALRKGNPDFQYELVEIPKQLLLKAVDGRLEMKCGSKQFPKPGYCYVEEQGVPLFNLYFDGGGERKLQIKALKVSQCSVHAKWVFDSPIEGL